MKKRRIYLDSASTTPVDSRVFRAMKPFFADDFGNPANLYEMGRRAKSAVLSSAEKISGALGCSPDEFYFTGSATEADNLALAGAARANREFGNRIIISEVEHKGVMAICEALAKEGFEIVKIPIGKNGLVNLGALKSALTEKTILVSITMADSETGTLQPLSEIAKILRDFRNSFYSLSPKPYPLNPFFHSDASQAAVYRDINVKKLGVDLLTVSSHKMRGPKGIAGLYVRRGIKINPVIFGGGAGKLRSGTENVPAIVGFGEAVALNQKNKKAESARIKKLRDKLERGIFKSIPKAVLNGHPKARLPNFLNVSILDVEGEALLLHLDELGIMVSTGSACNSENLEPSYVLSALGNPYEFIHGSIRFSLGKNTTEADIDYVLKNLPAVVRKLRAISPLNLKLNQSEKMSDPKAFVGNRAPHFLKRLK